MEDDTKSLMDQEALRVWWRKRHALELKRAFLGLGFLLAFLAVRVIALHTEPFWGNLLLLFVAAPLLLAAVAMGLLCAFAPLQDMNTPGFLSAAWRDEKGKFSGNQHQ